MDNNSNKAAAWKAFNNLHKQHHAANGIVANHNLNASSIMRPCPECKMLMKWKKLHKLDTRKCEHCLHEPDPEVVVDDHFGYNNEGHNKTQHGAPGMQQGGHKYAPGALAIGHGKGAHKLKEMSKYAQTWEHSEKLRYMYDKLVMDTLHALDRNKDFKPEAIKAAVMRDFEEYYARLPSRQWTKDMLNQLALGIDRAFARNRIFGISREKISSKIQEIYLRDYKKEATKNSAIANGVSRIGDAQKTLQRILAADQSMKKESDMASAMAVPGAHKEYITSQLATSGLDANTLSYISLTFDDILANIETGIVGAISKTTNPIMLAVSLRRHGILVEASDLKKLKPTAKRHYRPLLENSARLFVRVANKDENNGKVGNIKTDYIKLKDLFTKAMDNSASADTIYNMLVDFDNTTSKYNRLAQRATVLACLEKHNDILNKRSKKASNFTMNLPGATNARNMQDLWPQLAQLATGVKKPLFMIESWTRLADPDIIDNAVTVHMQIPQKEPYASYFKNSLIMTGYILDILCFSSILQKHGVGKDKVAEIVHKVLPFQGSYKDNIEKLISSHLLA